MLEADLIQTRGFHNIIRENEVIGFQFNVRLTYYRGIFLSQLRPRRVVVDGKVYPRETVVWNVNGQDYTFDEMKTASDVHWCPTDCATLKIYKKGGLGQGYHMVSAGYKYSSSYMPPHLQRSIDDETDDPMLNMLFGQLYSERELLLVW